MPEDYERRPRRSLAPGLRSRCAGELLELAADLARRGEPFALATVVARKPPISAQSGDMALVTRDGGFHGWVGGSCTRPTVIAEARPPWPTASPGCVALDPDPEAQRRPGLTVFPMTCHSGGSVEIHIQPVLPAPRLVVYGVSPTARALARLGKAMGYAVTRSTRPPTRPRSRAPTAVSTDPQALPRRARRRPLFAVVATQGQWDEEAILAALAREPRLPGGGGQPQALRRDARAAGRAGAGAPSWRAIKNPAGPGPGRARPEEIALSILAEIVEERRAAAQRRAAAPPRERRRRPRPSTRSAA